MSKSSNAPTSRPVHPCILSVFDGNSGAEYAAWAHVTTKKHELPNLVTAQASTLRVYTIDDVTGKLLLTHSFPDLAGTVCYLAGLPVEDGSEPDSLLLGFAGHARLVIVSVTSASPTTLASNSTMLMATTLIDLTHASMEHCVGSVTPLEQDLMATAEKKGSNVVSVSVVLGGGIAIAVITLRHVRGHNGAPSGWLATEPYILPLANLYKSIHLDAPDAQLTQTAFTATQSISHGFGDVLSVCFLPGYLEPTLVILHSDAVNGRTCPGRLGRPNGVGGTRFGLTATAISVTVSHRRSAILWSVEVPADAQSLHAAGKTGCLVMCVNSFVEIASGGHIGSVLCVNGWVRSSCPSGLMDYLQPNPWPLPKLSVQLDGASLAFISDQAAFVSLRHGQLYLLQHIGDAWGMVPLGHTLGAAGQVSNILTLPFAHVPKGLQQALIGKKTLSLECMVMGLVFAGSRLGDSSLLGYTLETNVTLLEPMKDEEREPGKKPKLDDAVITTVKKEDECLSDMATDDYEVILRREEDALYAPTSEEFTEVTEAEISHVIPASDEETEDVVESYISPIIQNKRSRPRLGKMSVVRSLNALDSILSLGPLGPGCEGPLSRSRLLGLTESILEGPQTSTFTVGGTAQIFPCGYGSSGGVALLTAPGRDDRSILAEADCLNMQCMFSLPLRGIVLMGKTGSNATSGVSVLRTQHISVKAEDGKKPNNEIALLELDLHDWYTKSEDQGINPFESPLVVLQKMKLLCAQDLDDNHFAVVVSDTSGDDIIQGSICAVVLFSESDGKLQNVVKYSLFDKALGTIQSSTNMIRHNEGGESRISFGCTWSSGNATVTTISLNGEFKTGVINCSDPPSNDVKHEDLDEDTFYLSDRVTAIDVFMAPVDSFESVSHEAPTDKVELPSGYAGVEQASFDLSDEDAELYGESQEGPSSRVEDSNQTSEFTRTNLKGVDSSGGQNASDNGTLYVAVCRQSGSLQLFNLLAFQDETQVPTCHWEAQGCGHGSTVLEQNLYTDSKKQYPRMHQVQASEIRFFFAGPTESRTPFRQFYLVVETSVGDIYLYKKASDFARFTRVPLRLVARLSKEQSRHNAKLRRKGILAQATDEQYATGLGPFRFNRLHPFVGVSGQDGLFAAIARPMWFVSERGSISALWHRSRHVAPAGGKDVPITGFCVGLQDRALDFNSGFMTLHERIGRVGSQRLTMFRGISDIYAPHGFFPGGGTCAEKVLLGVTVRHVQFIDDSSVSSGAHPLYAVLISRELESDQSHLNDDGLTLEERQRMKDEKEGTKIKRQVEADLGGFDLEQEWVEEIEREDCFEVDKALGGAPPIQKRAYALWIVDASNNWNVVDSFELGEFEHGMTMQIMPLSEVNEEPGSSGSVVEGDVIDSIFVAIGTGIVDQDGEDVSSKGRVLLFQVKRQDESSLGSGSQVADLSLVYEKDILHGAVTSLSCLSCEGRSRLVIGAGSDVNVEQWGNGKLTQVGFFRANMQILDILLFKTFFLLSDAYDSLYFLVWRESDKSLTLLAKDYEPIPVFAAGLLSRGGSVSFVCHDDRQNLQFFQYAPGDAAARGGNKLVCRADVHMGCQTVTLQSYFCKSSLLVNSATPASTLAALKQQDSLFGRTDDDQRLGVHFGTSDGGYQTIIPLGEPVYWRLTALQSVMANALESNCALSHRAWRLYRRTPRRGGCRNNDRKKGVIDGDLVIQYADLPLTDQEDLASAIGSTVELILDNLVELRCASMVI